MPNGSRGLFIFASKINSNVSNKIHLKYMLKMVYANVNIKNN